jgi:hypothetical protein
MARMVLPAAFRPSTALPGVSDLRDENVYSSVILSHGGQGTAKCFTVPQGQAIPNLTSFAAPALPPHQAVYSLLTTNLEKAGELGNNLGDAGVRAIGVTFEQAGYTSSVLDTAAALARRTFGMGPLEVADVTSKCYLEIKVSNKRQIVGPIWAFPQTGGAVGSATMSSNVTAGGTVGTIGGFASNGSLPVGRKLRVPIMVARNDVLVAEVSAYAALAFGVTATPGAPSLVWINLISTVKGDAR